jgi:L-threonylcarbamoyladenylate synthase
MAQYLTLAPENFQESVESATSSLNDGGIAVLAAEHGYVYACNAFDHDAVSRIHTLRGDPAYTACQVMVGRSEVLAGLATDFDNEMKLLADAFWPGLLTVHLMPHHGLNWDLGDGGELSEFAVRVPDRDLLRAVAASTGPLAVASAAIVGRPPTREINFVPALESSIAIYVDEGTLHEGVASSVIRRKILGTSGGLEMSREGAISLEVAQAILPSLTAQRAEEPPVN